MKGFTLAICGFTAAATTGVQGLGLRVPDQDAKAMARGNAFAATADNPSAVYYNPAGIAQLEGHQIRNGGYLISVQDTFTALNGAETRTKDRPQFVPQFYYTYGNTNWPVSLGAGVYAPYGLGMQWPDDGPFRQSATRGSLEYLTFQPVVAWKAHPTFSLAAGPTVSYGKVDLRRGILPVNRGDEFRFTGDDFNVGFSLGLLWKPLEQHAFGLVYRGPSKMDFGGKTYLGGGPVPGRVESAGAEMDFPQQMVAGYSFRPTPKWNLEFNADWTDWDTLNTVSLNQTGPLALAPVPLPFNYQASLLYEWGVTRYFERGWSVSGGYIYSQNSIPSAFFSPSVPDSDRHVFSLGVGRQYEHLRWDAAYQFAWGPGREVASADPSATGRYSFNSHAIALSIGYAF